MEFESIYTCVSEKDKPENKNKIVLSDDAYAVCEMIEKLINETGRVK